MSMFRTFRTMPKFNFISCLVFVGLFLCFVVYIVQYLFLLQAPFRFILTPIATILFIFLVWSFLKVYLSQPGSVPIFWGVQFTEQNKKQPRKYCLICHNFKPQRTHHCSACNKCVLNMDHHCPFVNNCIGFYNRKFFMLFLFYLLVNIGICLIAEGYLLVKQLIPIIRQQASATIHTAVRIIFIIFEIGVFFPVLTFAAYHLTLIFKNQTTLTQLKRQRDQKNGKQVTDVNIYDVGAYHNFTQVFGKKKWQWFLPITKTLPDDGLSWPKNSYYYEALNREAQTQDNKSYH